MNRVFTTLTFFFLLYSCNTDDNQQVTPDSTVDELSINVINDTFDGEPVVVYGKPETRTMVSFFRKVSDGTILSFETIQGADEFILGKDQEGNVWDIFGKAVSGDRFGEQLSPTHSVNSFWFTVSATFPGIELYSGTQIEGIPIPITNSDWCVPVEYINQGSVPDGIPAILNPVFETFTKREIVIGADHLNNDTPVTVVKNGAQVKVYPHSILDYHEIVNDELDNGQKIAVLFCPLAGASSVWDRDLEEGTTNFGVSGFLYNLDLIAYDSQTGSGWLQLTGKCIAGDNITDNAKRVEFFDTTWGALPNIFPNIDVEVLTTDTGFNFDYGFNQFLEYEQDDNNLPFPVLFTDTRVPNKETVHSLISGDVSKAKTFRLENFK